jgi:hypothetical protein
MTADHLTADHRLGRRDWLRSSGGLGMAALASLLGTPSTGRAETGRLAPSHFPPQAKRVIYLFQSGGPSQLELFDYKPGLKDLHGSELPDSIRRGQRLTGMTSGQKSFPVISSKFGFEQSAETGHWISELLPHTRRVMKELCVIRSVHTEAINHDPAITFIQTGSQQPGRPRLVPGPAMGWEAKPQTCPPSW